jgi:hypothetical protein
MTQLVEDITIKITLNHCEGNSDVLGCKRDLREEVAECLKPLLHGWLDGRQLKALWNDGAGIDITYENTGLYEAPETGGGDN